MTDLQKKLAEDFGYENFEDMDTAERSIFYWCIENRKLFYSLAYNEGFEDGYKDAMKNKDPLQPDGA